MNFSNQLTFTLAGAENLEEIFAMFRAAVEEMERQGILQWDEVYPDRVALQNDILKQQLFVGLFGSEIVCAYVVNQECDAEYGKGNWQYPAQSALIVHRLCVNPNHQHKGIARQTMQHIELQGRQDGARSIRLDCFTRNPYALKLYENLGYVKTGIVTWRKGDFYLMEKSI